MIATQPKQKEFKFKKLTVNDYKCEVSQAININPRCTNISFGTWIKPHTSFNEDVPILTKHLKHTIKRTLRELFQLNDSYPYIIDIQHSIASNSVNERRLSNSYTYMSIELCPFFVDKVDINDTSLLMNIELLLLVIADLLDDCREVTCQPTR